MEADQGLLTSFFVEVEDYYEEITKGISLINSDQISAGIDTVLRPLHSIKGTSGFISGLEDISNFTHKVEDYLKDIQNGKIPAMPKSIELLTKSVDMVFDLIDHAKNEEKIDNTGYKEVLACIEKISHPELSSTAEKIIVEDKNNTCFIRVNMDRIHLPGQYQAVTEIFDRIKNGKKIVFDLSKVRTISSTAWGAIWSAGERMNISVIGMSESCKATFFAWGFDRLIHAFKSEEDFWKNNKMTTN